MYAITVFKSLLAFSFDLPAALSKALSTHSKRMGKAKNEEVLCAYAP